MGSPMRPNTSIHEEDDDTFKSPPTQMTSQNYKLFTDLNTTSKRSYSKFDSNELKYSHEKTLRSRNPHNRAANEPNMNESLNFTLTNLQIEKQKVIKL